MNDMYAEARVKVKMTPTSLLLRGLMILGMLVAFFVLPVIHSVFMIVSAGIVVVLIYMFPRLNVEYEYVFVDGQFDFDKISGGSKRKTVLRIDMEKIEMIAPVNSHALDEFRNKKLVTKDFSSLQKSDKLYAIIAHGEKELLRIVFEPSAEMITCMKNKSPRKVATM